DGLALGADQLRVELRLAIAHGPGRAAEARREVRVLRARERLGPVEREVEVAPAVVDLAHLARRRPVGVEELADRLVEAVGERLRARVRELRAHVLERRAERRELPERVP